jgi:hypothetical protein
VVRDDGSPVVGAGGELLVVPELVLSLGTAILEVEISALDSVTWTRER